MHTFNNFYWAITTTHSFCIEFMWQGANCGGGEGCTAWVGSSRRAIQRYDTQEGSTGPSAKSCTCFGVIPNISTDWGMNGLKTVL